MKILSKIKTVTNISLVGWLFFSLSCSYSPDKNASSNQSKKMAEQNAQTASNFGRIAGSYSGILKTVHGDELIQLNLTTLAISEGIKNPDGSDRIRITLAATYLKISPVGKPLVNFAISYTPETAELTLINQDDKSKKDLDEVNTIFARVIDGKITGSVKSATNELGNLLLEKTSNGSASTPNGTQEEYNERLRKQYLELSGNYIGCVIPTEDGSLKKPYTAKMTLSIYEDNNDPNNTTPTLAGNFHRDTDKTDGTDTALIATYRPDLVPATLTIIGKPYISNNGYVSTFNGIYENGEFKGTFTSNKKGLEGRIILTKNTQYPKQCLIALLRMEMDSRKENNP